MHATERLWRLRISSDFGGSESSVSVVTMVNKGNLSVGERGLENEVGRVEEKEGNYYKGNGGYSHRENE